MDLDSNYTEIYKGRGVHWNDVMFARSIGFEAWPCIIILEDDFDMKEQPNEDGEWYSVQYFKPVEHIDWVTREDLYPYQEYRDEFLRIYSENREFVRAVDKADTELEMQLDNPGYYITIDAYKEKPAAPNTNFIFKEKRNKNAIGIITSSDGYLGKAVAKNCLLAGHSVNVFDASTNNFTNLLEELQEFGNISQLLSGWSVVKYSNKIFLCLKNGDELKEQISKSFEVTSGFNILMGKSIINMTNIVPEESVKLSKFVQKSGGRYLELAFQGGKTAASDGLLDLFAAGNLTLFTELQPILQTIGQTVDHLGEPGTALQTNQVIELFKATSLVCYTESLALISKLGIPLDLWTKLLKDVGLFGDYIEKKSKLILADELEESDPEEPLNDLQQNIQMCVDSVKDNSTIPLLNEVNETFIECQEHNLGELDCAAVVEAAFDFHPMA